MKKRDVIIGISILIVFIGVIVSVTVFREVSKDSEDLTSVKSPRVGVIEIEGPIRDSKATVDWIEKLRKNINIKSVVVHINSPGGAVAPSQEIYSALLRLKKAGKPVVASMSSVAASGGYYIAIASDSIVANAGTITGSIGVILSFPIYNKLADKIGVKMEVIKSGKLKDVGNPFRELNTEERAYLQSSIDDTYDQFVGAVAEQRGLSIDSTRKLADGRIYTGRQAKSVGLIDVIGTYHDAIRLAGRLGGISGEPRIFEKKKKTNLLRELLLGEDSNESKGFIDGFMGNSIFENSPVIEYRWVLN